MAIEYPTELPLPLREGYGMQHVSPLQRTEMDSGRARQRRRFTSVPTIVSASWLMTNGQAALFENWFKYAAMDGAAWFKCPLQTPSGGIKHYDARFTDIYSGPELVGTSHWRFTAEIELRERETLFKDWHEYAPGFIAGLGGDVLSFMGEAPPTFFGGDVQYNSPNYKFFGVTNCYGGPEDSYMYINGTPLVSEDGTALISLALYADASEITSGQVLQSIEPGVSRIDFSLGEIGVNELEGYGNFYVGGGNHSFRYENDSALIMSLMLIGGETYLYLNGALVASVTGVVMPEARISLLRGTVEKIAGAYVSSFVVLRKGVTARSMRKVVEKQARDAGVKLDSTVYRGISYIERDSVYCAVSSSGDIIANSGGEVEKFPASLTKIALLLVAVEYMENADILTVQSGDIRQDSLLAAGDEISFYDACVAAMVASSNTSANLIARYAGDMIDGGGVESCVREMNTLVKSIGAGNTNFVNASGLYSPSQVTTSRDMAFLGLAALNNSKVVGFMGREGGAVIRINNSDVSITSTVKNIGENGVFAGKTGTISSPTVGTSAVLNLVNSGGLTYSLVIFSGRVGNARFDLAETVIEGIRTSLEVG